MNRLGLLLVAVGCAACQPAEQVSTDAAVSEDLPAGPPVAAAVAADCPRADGDGHVAIADGLDARVLKKGYGTVALLGDRVTVNAKLWVHDPAAEGGKGNFVWDSGDGGFTFDIGAPGMIDGWSPGVACMIVGEKRELIIASELAYGESGRAPIPGNADIIYDLELVSVQSAEQ